MTRRHLIVGFAFCLVLGRCLAQTAPESASPGPQNVPELMQRSQELVSANRLAEAEALLMQCYSLAPADDRVITLLAQVKGRLGESHESVKLFRQVAVAEPKSATAHLNLAIALADTTDTGNALEEIQKAIRLDPKNSRAHLNRARMLTDLHRPAEARLEFATASHLDPADPDIYFFRGTLERDEHHNQEASAQFAKVVDLQPENVRARILLAQSQQALGESAAALATWKKAVALDPSSEEATYALAQALRRTDPAASDEMLQRFEALHADKRNRERVRELGNQAYAAMQKQDWQTAVTTLQQAIALCAACSLQADLHERLGLAECHSGDLDAGERELHLALSLNPRDRIAVEALQWVAAQKNP